MTEPLPVPELVEHWLEWAKRAADQSDDPKQNDDLIGFDEFDWVVREHPEHAWQCIVAAVADPRIEPYVGILAAGPMEDLLSYFGEQFIDRVELEAKQNPAFASMLGGVWRFQMSSEVWERVQAVWDRRGWDGNP